MRQRCELCEALGADHSHGHKLIGVAVGPRDVLLCADHALFALDSEVTSLAELREVYEFVALMEPSADEAAFVASSKRGRHAERAARSGRVSRSVL
jgi:hypothetical protein